MRNKASFIIALRKAIEWLAQSSCLNAGISNIPLRGVFDYTFSLYPLVSSSPNSTQSPHDLSSSYRWCSFWPIGETTGNHCYLCENDLYQSLTLYLILLFLCLKSSHKSLVLTKLPLKGLAWQVIFLQTGSRIVFQLHFSLCSKWLFSMRIISQCWIHTHSLLKYRFPTSFCLENSYSSFNTHLRCLLC